MMFIDNHDCRGLFSCSINTFMIQQTSNRTQIRAALARLAFVLSHVKQDGDSLCKSHETVTQTLNRARRPRKLRVSCICTYVHAMSKHDEYLREFLGKTGFVRTKPSFHDCRVLNRGLKTLSFQFRYDVKNDMRRQCKVSRPKEKK